MPVIPDDPFGSIKSPGPSSEKVPPKVVNEFHRASDVDVHANAQHHTLGPKTNQASPGNHIHDGRSARLIGDGMNLTVQTSSGTADQKIDRLINMLKSVMNITVT